MGDTAVVVVVVQCILVDECAVVCPTCRARNRHTVGPPGALISNRPWGHRVCSSRNECPGYVLQPADNVLLYDDDVYTHSEGVAAGNKADYLRAMRQARAAIDAAAPPLKRSWVCSCKRCRSCTITAEIECDGDAACGGTCPHCAN
jgi:hypothetical protein